MLMRKRMDGLNEHLCGEWHDCCCTNRISTVGMYSEFEIDREHRYDTGNKDIYSSTVLKNEFKVLVLHFYLPISI